MLACLTLAAAANAQERPGAPRRPNIVIILADDLGYGETGAQGCSDVPTPHIDSIAENGVRFTDGYATHPVCSPSRAGLLTGQYQHRFGFEHNSGPERYASPEFGIPRSIPTIAERLGLAGYATGMVGKWHVGFREGLRPHERGFDFHYGFLSGARSYYPDSPREQDPIFRNGEPVTDEKEYLTDAFGREAAAFIDRSKESPFFLYVAFNAVHAPLEASAKYEQRFPDVSDPKRKTYAGMTAAMDDAVGRILDELREHGLEQNTLVFFYSDNGGPTAQTTSRNDPLRGAKGQLFEGGIRVPFFVQWKGTLPAGGIYREMVMGFDVHATALAAAGVTQREHERVDGVDLLPFLRGEVSGPPHESLFWRAGRQHAARVGNWKLVQEPRLGGEMLFDLAADIGERTNLAKERPDKLRELQAAHAAWDQQMMPAKWVRQDARNAAPGGRRQEEARPADPAQPPEAADRAFRRLDADGDGRVTRKEAPNDRAFSNADGDGDGVVTLAEFRRFWQTRNERDTDDAPPRTPQDVTTAAAVEPPRKALPDCDAVRDAAGRGQLFECVHVAGLTDVPMGMNGFAIRDLDRDGLLDVVATFSRPATAGGRTDDELRVLLNDGEFRFRRHTIAIRGSALTASAFGMATQIPNLADFDGDGWIDIVVTRSAPAQAGRVRRGAEPLGTTFLLGDGAWDRFVDVSQQLGARNEVAYNRQSSLGDVNGDGWLDMAIGCDNIGNAMGGVPHSRLYVYRPGGSGFLDGRFEDIGGTALVPDFGGFHHDSSKDKAGPGISLRDLDNDGDLDLLQSYHVDVREPLLPYSPGEYRQGVMCWRNLLRETGELRFEKVMQNGLHCEARLRYDREKRIYEPASDARAPGLPYVSFADVDRDGLMDVLAVGPNSDFWAPRVEDVSARFWKNLGAFRFEDRTAAVGFDAINNTYRQWVAFFDEPIPRRYGNWQPRVQMENQPGKVPTHPLDRRPYYADAVFADFDNDGWLDVVVLDRSESNSTRAVLLLGTDDGTFEVKPTTFSGLDASGISGEAADLDGDGLLDLVFAADPDNSSGGRQVDPSRYESKVYWNTGAHGARENRWLRVTFSGLCDAALIGARVELIAGDAKQYRWIHSNHTYKSGGALDAHFGLGTATHADVTVKLIDGRTRSFVGLAADVSHTLELK
jgi:arylsulfatase A-like enzyme